MADARPVVFFDSGVGGLSILAEAQAHLPMMPVVYAADNAGFPYGTKREEEIAARVPALLGRLVERFDPRLLVIACNTASTIALGSVRAALELPVVGTVPAIKPAAEISRSRVIGVLGTDATVRQPYVDDLSTRFANDCRVLRHGSAELVEAAEAHLRGQPVDPSVFTRAIVGLTSQPGGDAIDTIVLACTHFPLLRNALAAAAGPGIGFVDSGAGIARRIAHLTADQTWPDTRPAGVAVFTRDDPGVTMLHGALARHGLGKITCL